MKITVNYYIEFLTLFSKIKNACCIIAQLLLTEQFENNYCIHEYYKLF